MNASRGGHVGERMLDPSFPTQLASDLKGEKTAMALTSQDQKAPRKRGIDKTHWLYIAVIIAVLAGITVGLVLPEFGKALKPVGEAFVALIKMMIAPIIFCTIVLGVGSIAKAATVGKVGGLALLYFITMSTFALGIGMVVGNFIHPGEGLNIASASYEADAAKSEGTADFLLGIIRRRCSHR